MASRRQNDREKTQEKPKQQPQNQHPSGARRYVVTLPREYQAQGEVKKEFLKVGSMFVNEASHTCTIYLYVDLRRGDELVCFKVGENNRG